LTTRFKVKRPADNLVARRIISITSGAHKHSDSDIPRAKPAKFAKLWNFFMQAFRALCVLCAR